MFLQSRVRDPHKAHFFDASTVELAHGAVLVSLLLCGRVPCLGAVKQLVRICKGGKIKKKKGKS